MLSHYPSNINSKPKTNTKCKANTFQTQTKKKKKTKIRPIVWKTVVTRRPEGGEKERGRENRLEIHVFWPDLSLYSSHRSSRAWVSAGSGRKPSRDPVARPVLTDRPDLVARPILANPPDPVDVRLQSPVGEGKKNDREL